MSELRVDTIAAASEGQNLVLEGGAASEDGTIPAGVVTLPAGSMLGTTPLGEGGGGAWNLIGTAEADDIDILTVTGLDNTYETYGVVISDVIPTMTRRSFQMRFGDVDGPDSGNVYRYHVGTNASNADAYSATNSTGASSFQLGADVSNNNTIGVNSTLFIHRPTDASMFPSITGNSVWSNDTGFAQGGAVAGQYNAPFVLDRVHVFFNENTITSGRLSVWGIAHA